MKKLHLIILLIFGFFSTKNSYAQVDTEFWFVVPEVSKTVPYILDSPIVFRIVTYGTPATVTIEQPAGGTSGMPTSTLTIPANTTQTFSLNPWLNILENRPPNTVLNKGIKITSTAPISVYYEIISGFGSMYPRRDNPEIFTLKGKLALGKVFSIPAQNILNLDYARLDPDPSSAFEILATEDNTKVTITPTHNIVGHAAGETFTITLNKGQTYSATNTSQLSTQQLNGSKVVADKPISVTVKQDGVRNTSFYTGLCTDVIGEQIVPIKLLGTNYIAINGNLNGPGSYIFVIGIKDGTEIFKDGASLGTIDAGETLAFPIGANACFIESSEIINVYQLSGIGCEFGATQLPQINCTGSQSVSYVVSTDEQLWFNIFTRPEYINNFTVNGDPLIITSSDFNVVPATDGEWVYVRKNLGGMGYTIGTIVTLANDIGYFHLGILDGGLETGSNYGYFSNYGARNETFTPLEYTLDSTICIGDVFTYTYPPDAKLVSWDDGSTVDTKTFTESGSYWIEYITANCVVVTQHLNLNFIDCPLSIDDIPSNVNSIEIIPNPFTDEVHIKRTTNSNEIYLINIFDQFGRNVYQYEMNQPEIKLDLSFLSSGVYFVQVNGGSSMKIIKK